MPEFDDDLAKSISAAKAKLAEREEAQRAAEAVNREQARSKAERFAEIKSRATRFNHNHLEKLFRKLHQKVSEAGFHFVGNYVNDEWESRGTVGTTLECGEQCYIQAAISYGLDQSVAHVDAQTPKGPCYSASQEFNEATSQGWFEANVAQAIGKLLESGEVPSANLVRYVAR